MGARGIGNQFNTAIALGIGVQVLSRALTIRTLEGSFRNQNWREGRQSHSGGVTISIILFLQASIHLGTNKKVWVHRP